MDLSQFLSEQLASLEASNLLRKLRPSNQCGPVIRIDNKDLVNFASNDYLGLSQHDEVKAAGRQAIEEFGAGSGASRLLAGSLQVHHDLEAGLARFKETE